MDPHGNHDLPWGSSDVACGEMSDRIQDFWQDYCSLHTATFGRTSGMRMKKKAAASSRRQPAKISNGMVDFSYANVSYQIDPSRRKVYHRWVEVETAKTCLIMGAWSQTRAQEKRAV